MGIFLAAIVGLLWIGGGITCLTLIWMRELNKITLTDAIAIGVTGTILGPICVGVWAWQFLPTGPDWEEIVIWRRKE